MQQNSSFLQEEIIPFYLQKLSQKENVIFISSSHDLLLSLYNNLKFLNCKTVILAPKFSHHLNHTLLDDHSFIHNYIETFEQQPDITLIHSSLLTLPMPEPDKYGYINLQVNEEYFITAITKKLIEFGYTMVPVVHNSSEFAVRGYIIDFATNNENIRIEFLGNKIEAIKTFDVESQKSIDVLEQVKISPNKFLLPALCNFENFPARYQVAFQEENIELYNAVQYHTESCDVNKYTKLLLDSYINILEILSGTIVFHNMQTEDIFKDLMRFEEKHNITPNVLYFSQKEVKDLMQSKNSIININTL